MKIQNGGSYNCFQVKPMLLKIHRVSTEHIVKFCCSQLPATHRWVQLSAIFFPQSLILLQACPEPIPVFIISFQFISLPLYLLPFSTPLPAFAVFWLQSCCHEEITTMAPLCQRTLQQEECLFNDGMV